MSSQDDSSLAFSIFFSKLLGSESKSRSDQGNRDVPYGSERDAFAEWRMFAVLAKGPINLGVGSC